MKAMKARNIFLGLCLCGALSAAAGEPVISENLSMYLKGCEEMMRALDTGDRHLMNQAIDDFCESDITDLGEENIIDKSDNIGIAGYGMNEASAEMLLTNGMDLAQLDDASMLRGLAESETISVYPLVVPAGETVSMTVKSSGETYVAATSGRATVIPVLRVTDIANGDSRHEAVTLSQYPAAYASWDRQNDGPFRVELTNPAETPQTFMLIFR